MNKSVFLNNNWATFIYGIIIGCVVPSLIAWGVIRAKVETIDNKLDIAVFNEYKMHIERQFESTNWQLRELNRKIDKLLERDK